MNIERWSQSEDQTLALAGEIGQLVNAGEIIALKGELGSGKTCFVRGLTAGLGGDATSVSSPTFVICQEYHISNNLTLAHVDAYRLQGEEELESIGWDDLINNDTIILAIEWPERIKDHLSDCEMIEIDIQHISETTRRLSITIPDKLTGRFKSIIPKTRPCNTCKENVSFESPYFPFCSERCRLIDLGEWFDEKHTISRSIEEGDEIDDYQVEV